MRQLALALSVTQDNIRSAGKAAPALTFDTMPHPGRDEWKYFGLSIEWRKLRYATLVANDNNCCMACGNSWTVGNPLQVDHIKPRSLYPHLALEQDNLQVLCRECNMGKGALDMTDWRRLKPP